MTPTPWLTESEAVSYLRIEGKRPREYLQRLCRTKKILWVKAPGSRNYLFKQEWLDRAVLSNGHPALRKMKAA